MTHIFSIKSALVMTTSAIILAACGGGGGDNDYTPPPTSTVPDPPVVPDPDPPMPPVQGTPQSMAGGGFEAAFNAGAFVEPIDPMANDIIPLSKSAEPFDIPNP